jgi:MoxR-like ATPase
MMKITMDHPGLDEELDLARKMLGADSPEAVLARGEVKPVIGATELATLRQALQGILVREELLAYLVEIVRKTRAHDSVLVGAGPRATQSLLLASRALAALSGRDFVTPDDIKTLAVPAMEHRLVLRPEFEIENLSVKEVVLQILEEIAVPR